MKLVTALSVVLATTPEQREQSLNIRKQVFVQEQGVDQRLEIDQFEDTCLHFLVFSEDTPVATGRCRVKGHLYKFERIATVKSYRGLGVGKFLMEHMQNYVFENAEQQLPYCHSQISAIEFYLRLDWKIVGDSFFEAGIEHKRMIKIPPNINQLSLFSSCEHDQNEKLVKDYFDHHYKSKG